MTESFQIVDWLEEIMLMRQQATASLEDESTDGVLEYLKQLKLEIEDHFSLVQDRVARGDSAPIEEAWLLGGYTFPLLSWFETDCNKAREAGLEPPELEQELIDFVVEHFPGFTKRISRFGAEPVYEKSVMPRSVGG